MYLRLVRFTLAEGSQMQAQAMASDLIPAIKQQPGCLSATFFGGGDNGENGLCVLWDSQEHANASAMVIGPRLQEHLAGRLQGMPSMDLFPVIAS